MKAVVFRGIGDIALENVPEPSLKKASDAIIRITVGLKLATAESPYCLTRVYLFTQFVSQVLPPSFENACSDCAESSVIFQMENRTQIYLPLNSSWS